MLTPRRAAAPLILLLLGACTTTDPGQLGRSLKSPYLQEEEVRRSAEGARQRATQGPGQAVSFTGARGQPLPPPEVVPGDAAVNRYLDGILARLLRAWPHGAPGVTPHARLVAEGSFPSARPDGLITVPIGFLADVASEDELAFVLGHELAHILLGHTRSREEEVAELVGVNGATVALVVTGAQAAVQIAGRAASSVSAEAGKVAAIAALSGLAANEALNTLVDPAWGRRQEAAADLLGIDLATRAGFDPRHATRALDRLAATQRQATSQAQAAGEAVQREVTAELGRGNLQAGVQRGVQGLGRIMIGALQDLREDLRGKHPSPTERETWIAEYRDRFYIEAPSRGDDLGPLAQLRRAQPIAGYGDAQAHLATARNLVASDSAGAVQSARSAARALPTPTNRTYLGLTLDAAGQPRQAREELERLRRENRLPIAGYPALARIQFGLGDQRAAAATLDAGETAAGSAEVMLPARIALSLRQGNRAAAHAAAERCATSRDDRLRQSCRNLMETR